VSASLKRQPTARKQPRRVPPPRVPGGKKGGQAPEKRVVFQLPRKLGFLMEMHPYKVAYGGRNSLKSWSFARALLTLGVHQPLRILCAREVQKSLAQSVHQLLQDQIVSLGLEDEYDVTENAIRGRRQGTLFRFTGLSDQTVSSIKSYEGFDICWVEEAHSVRKRSWQILLPTIFRTKNAEVWVSFNPDMDTDEAWERFVVHTPPGAVVIQMNWRDAIACGWWSPDQERLRQYDLVHSKDDYPNIWDGKPRVVVAGAIYAHEVVEMISEKRYRPVPYDPRLPVHRIWDLGWNDLMTVIMVQRPHPSALNIINYIEDSHITYPALLLAMDQLHYRIGIDYLPHDGETHDPKSGTSAKKMLVGLGCTVRIIPKSHPEARIKAGRMMFPRIYMDNSKFDTDPDRPDRVLGGAHLMGRLKTYKRNVPKTTAEPTTPTHDIASHGADAYGGLAEIVDQIRNDGEVQRPKLPAFVNVDPGMGLLG
jgi:phage terminase large subunit